MSVDILIARPWERAGITYRQFDHWITKGFMPGGHPGHGHSREYTREDFARLTRMARLVRHGLQPKAAAAFIDAGKADDLLKVMDA